MAGLAVASAMPEGLWSAIDCSRSLGPTWAAWATGSRPLVPCCISTTASIDWPMSDQWCGWAGRPACTI